MSKTKVIKTLLKLWILTLLSLFLTSGSSLVAGIITGKINGNGITFGVFD